MPRLEDAFSSDLVKGLTIGAGLAVLVPLAVSLATGAGRPALRRALKSGLVLLERGRETLAETGEAIEDLLAEVQAELREDAAGAEAQAAAAASVAVGAESVADTAPESVAGDKGE